MIEDLYGLPKSNRTTGEQHYIRAAQKRFQLKVKEVASAQKGLYLRLFLPIDKGWGAHVYDRLWDDRAIEAVVEPRYKAVIVQGE